MSTRNQLSVILFLALFLFTGSVARTPDAQGQSTGFKILGGPFAVSGGSVYWLDSSNSPEGWKLLPNGSFSLPPINLSDLAYYNGITAITDLGEGWVKIGGVWTDIGPIPGTATVRTTWGQVKDKYRR